MKSTLFNLTLSVMSGILLSLQSQLAIAAPSGEIDTFKIGPRGEEYQKGAETYQTQGGNQIMEKFVITPRFEYQHGIEKYQSGGVSRYGIYRGPHDGTVEKKATITHQPNQGFVIQHQLTVTTPHGKTKTINGKETTVTPQPNGGVEVQHELTGKTSEKTRTVDTGVVITPQPQ